MNEIFSDFKHRVIGIDPGLAATGYAVVGTLQKGGRLCSWGAVKTAAGQETPARLQVIYHEIRKILGVWQPELMVLEDVYVLDKFPSASVQLGEVRGVIYLTAQELGIQILKIRPTEVKSCLTGSGRASKEQVKEAVRRMLGCRQDIKPDHASDAAALALIALSRKGYLNF